MTGNAAFMLTLPNLGNACRFPVIGHVRRSSPISRQPDGHPLAEYTGQFSWLYAVLVVGIVAYLTCTGFAG